MTEIRKSEKTGSSHWVFQRISAVILIFLVLWLGYSFFTMLSDPTYIETFFSYITNTVLAILFICTCLYHGCLGMQTVIEDYVSCKKARKITITIINIFSLITAISVVIAIVRLHIIL
ncbi:succinate dehydrogenase, hydrophobic membrane anchor protein [Rickettsiales bacterium]|nr:succinate dehydrogenase, hydrophobic membrane anchor protein [Rickettsiales bacterium]